MSDGLPKKEKDPWQVRPVVLPEALSQGQERRA